MPQNPIWTLMLLVTTIGLLVTGINGYRLRAQQRHLEELSDDPAALRAYAEAQLMPTGIDGIGTVLQVTDLGGDRRGRRRVDLEVAIAITGRAPYTVHKPELLNAKAVASTQVGMSFPVRVDATNPNHVLMFYGARPEPPPNPATN